MVCWPHPIFFAATKTIWPHRSRNRRKRIQPTHRNSPEKNPKIGENEKIRLPPLGWSSSSFCFYKDPFGRDFQLPKPQTAEPSPLRDSKCIAFFKGQTSPPLCTSSSSSFFPPFFAPSNSRCNELKRRRAHFFISPLPVFPLDLHPISYLPYISYIF